MAGELQASFQAGKTCYFLIRNRLAQIWNTAASAFETYATANYADYDIAAAEQGAASGYYVGTMPATAAGVYYLVAKEQVGGSPAESDITVGTGAIQWDGSAALPLSGVPITTMAANIASVLLKRDVDLDEGAAAVHSLLSAILKLVSKFDVQVGSDAVTYRTDGVTPHMTQARTTNAALVATESLDVGV